MADLKQLARRIFQETLSAIDIPETMRRKLQREGTRIRCGDVAVDLRQFRAVRVVAFGKAAHAMVDGLVSILGAEFPREGIVSAPVAPKRAQPGIRYFAGGHPVPNEASLAAAEEILKLLRGCGEETLILFLLSGGGSALVERLLVPGATLADVQALHSALVTCGAPIDSMNAVRKHLSAVKGGRLAAAAPRATKLTYAISDVPLGRESALASGPTIPDPTTSAEAEQVMGEYALREKFPARLREWLEQNAMEETPKSGDAAFEKSHFALLLGMDDLFRPARAAAEAAGCVAQCDNATDDWPVPKAAEHLLEMLEKLRAANAGRPVALIADGEVSSPVTGNGIGGRNSAFVLACVEKIAERNMAVLSGGTDGIDGNSPATGAVADGETLARARAAGMDARDAFQRSDAYTFFAQLGDALTTGPTGNNLRDLRILLAGD
jgi:glycerate 2-kinase